jgi:hypothetical protein
LHGSVGSIARFIYTSQRNQTAPELGVVFRVLIIQHDRTFEQADGFGEPFTGDCDHAEKEMRIGVFWIVGQHAQAALLCVSQAAAVQVLLCLTMLPLDFVTDVGISVRNRIGQGFMDPVWSAVFGPVTITHRAAP